LTISKERKKRVIDLYYNEEKTMREIAKIERMSIRDISNILKEEEARRQKDKLQQKRQEISTQAYQLFSEGKTSVQVAMALNLPASKVSKLYREYYNLSGLDKLNIIFKETNGKIWLLLKKIE
jgi:DNA-directed RNA polymerase specialized sigma subunit